MADVSAGHWRLQKAERFMNVAARALEAGDFETAVSRAYYASYHAVAWVLDSKAGVPRDRWDHLQLHLEFVRHFGSRGYLFSARQARDLQDLQTARLVADYENRQASPRQAAELVRRARALVSAVEEVA